MPATRFTLFDTALGLCALAWRDETIVSVLLPEGGAEQSRARLSKRFSDLAESPPTPPVENLITRIRALLDGYPIDLRDAPVDMSVFEPFSRQVYEIARDIPPGQAMTYGEIAERLGDKLLARDVGQAMGKNPYPSSSPATASSPPAASWAASPRAGAQRPNRSCWRSKAMRREDRRRCFEKRCIDVVRPSTRRFAAAQHDVVGWAADFVMG